MRFVLIPILLLLVMTQAFSNWFVVLAFNINKGYIAKNLCENRYRPKLNCNGKCVLMKKMMEKEKEEQNQPVSKTEIITIVLSSRTFFANYIPVEPVCSVSMNEDSRFPKPVDRSLAFFQPPRA